MADTRPAIIYAAKSTEDRHGSIPDQLAEGRALAEREGWTVVAEHQDEAFSAYSGDRGPGLASVQQKAETLAGEHGECAVVVQHSDRLARGDGKQAAHLVEYALWAIKSGVKLLSCQDPQTFGDLLYTVVTGQRNHEDSKRKSAAVKSGLRRRAQRGRHNGGPRAYGYRWEGPKGEKRLIVHEPEAAVVRRIFSEFVAGRAQLAIARDLNADGFRAQHGGEWYQGTIAKHIGNPIYAGRLRLKDEEFQGEHEPIVSAETWAQAEQLRSAKARTRGKGRGRQPKGRHLFTNGLLRCGKCGEAMIPRTVQTRTPGKLYEVYTCYGRIHHGTDHCSQGPIKREVVDSGALAYFEQVALDVDATRQQMEAALNEQLADAATLRLEAERAEQRAQESLRRVKRDYTDGKLTVEEWQEFRDELAPELEAAGAEAARVSEQEQALRARAKIDAEAETLRYLASLREAVVGDVRAAEGIDALRAALVRLFDSFVFRSEDGQMSVEAWPRIEAVGQPSDRENLPEGELFLRRLALPVVRGDKYSDALPSVYLSRALFEPIPLGPARD